MLFWSKGFVELKSARGAVVRHGSLALCLGVLAASLAPASGAGAVAGYGDVPEGAYYTDAVQWSADEDVTGVMGDCFVPARPVTRGEAAVWIWRMEGRPAAATETATSRFTDVHDVEQQIPVSWMAEEGFTTGTSPTTFSPSRTLTRAEAAALLWRLERDRVPAAPHGFIDVTRPWQQDPVSWMAEEGITTGTSPTTFSPDEPLTRGHLVTFLYRYNDSPPVALDPDTPTCTATAPYTGNRSTAAPAAVAEFAQVLSQRGAPQSMCLSVVVDGSPVIESQSLTPYLPASLVKIATAAAALEVMSPAQTFETSVFVGSDAWSSVADGTLRGDLHLVGGGDPVLSTPRYAQRWPVPEAYTDVTVLADQVFGALRDRGVTRIEGRVLGDDSYFPDAERDYTGHHPQGMPEPVWRASFVTSNDVGPLSALLLNGGYRSYGNSWLSDSRWRNVRASDPPVHAASVFDDLLEARGMVITQRPGSGRAPATAGRVPLGSVESPPLSKILSRMLSRSDNSIAEILFKEIGRRTGGSDRASAAVGVQAAIQRKLGHLAEGAVLADGSGLSYNNRLSCATVTELLRQAGPGSLLVNGLAEPWVSGSLRSCGPDAPTDNDIRAKTGQLDDAKALAGTVTTPTGSVLTFAMIANRKNITGDGFCSSLFKALLNAAGRYGSDPRG